MLLVGELEKEKANRTGNTEIYPVNAISILVKYPLVIRFIRTLCNSVIIQVFQVQITLVNIRIRSTVTF